MNISVLNFTSHTIVQRLMMMMVMMTRMTRRLVMVKAVEVDSLTR